MNDDLKDIKKKKMENMKSEMEEERKVQEEKEEQMEQMKKQMLRKILTSDARGRLSNLRMARPDFTKRVENRLIQIAKSGRIDTPLTDDQLKKVLKKLQSNSESIDIKRR